MYFSPPTVKPCPWGFAIMTITFERKPVTLFIILKSLFMTKKECISLTVQATAIINTVQLSAFPWPSKNFSPTSNNKPWFRHGMAKPNVSYVVIGALCTCALPEKYTQENLS